ncbi:MAG: translation initiation factor IF-2 N-terminal domain-containing protein, partial [Longimicrobiales bacterium]
MRVYEVAREFKVEPDALIQLLRELGAPVRSEASSVDDATVSRVRARLERERRHGHEDATEALEAAIEDAHTSTRRRRRRKKTEVEPEPIGDVAADAAEAIAAEAAEDAMAVAAEPAGAEEIAAEAVADAEQLAAEAEPAPALEEAAAPVRP